VGSPLIASVSFALLLATTHLAHSQQALVRPEQFTGFAESALPAANANGMLLAQNESAIEQSRLYRQTTPQVRVGVDANGNALAETDEGDAENDSFGSQKIMKTQERPTTFVVTGGASLVYTDNVALTRRGAIDDVFAVVDAGITWSPKVGHHLEPFFGFRASIFRYDQAEDLDFQNLGFGVGVAWTPPSLRGISIFARYDFTELLNRDGDQILMDHTITLGIQKGIALGRSHGLAFGATAMFGISDPDSAQRSQLGAFISYRLQLTRKLETDFLFRPAVHFYTDSGRVDFNQILSWNLRYRFTDWAEVNATVSYGVNRSERSTFDYNVLTTGVGVGMSIRF
jgi:hypothetical protein